MTGVMRLSPALLALRGSISTSTRARTTRAAAASLRHGPCHAAAIPRPVVTARVPTGAAACFSQTHHRRGTADMSAPASSSPSSSPSPASPATADGGRAGDRAPESGATAAAGLAPDAADEPKLPPLTGAQFRAFNRMAEHMEYFHNHFRQVWTMMYGACENRKRPAGMSIRQFLDEGLRFIQSLTAHHSIEEAYIFPVLAKRMPEFQPPGNKKATAGADGRARSAQLLQQHREIHVGMDGFEAYLQRCRSGETELDLAALKAQMDSWGKVLWQHLDDEVATLGAENMRKYWSAEEIKRMPM